MARPMRPHAPHTKGMLAVQEVAPVDPQQVGQLGGVHRAAVAERGDVQPAGAQPDAPGAQIAAQGVPVGVGVTLQAFQEIVGKQ